MTSFTLPIPTYQCHKRVQALKINAIVPSPRGLTLGFEDQRYAPIEVSEDWYYKHDPVEGGYFVVYEDGYKSFSPAAAFEAGYTLVETADGAVRQDASPEPLSVKVAEMRESNGRITWSVFIAKSPDAAPWDCHQVYSDAIEGRARYEAAVLAHFLGLGPAPDILAFDTDPPAEEVRPVGPAPDWSAWPGGPSEVEAALASRDAEIERLSSRLTSLQIAARNAFHEWNKSVDVFGAMHRLYEQAGGIINLDEAPKLTVGPATQAAREAGK